MVHPHYWSDGESQSEGSYSDSSSSSDLVRLSSDEEVVKAAAPSLTDRLQPRASSNDEFVGKDDTSDSDSSDSSSDQADAEDYHNVESESTRLGAILRLMTNPAPALGPCSTNLPVNSEPRRTILKRHRGQENVEVGSDPPSKRPKHTARSPSPIPERPDSDDHWSDFESDRNDSDFDPKGKGHGKAKGKKSKKPRIRKTKTMKSKVQKTVVAEEEPAEGGEDTVTGRAPRWTDEEASVVRVAKPDGNIVCKIDGCKYLCDPANAKGAREHFRKHYEPEQPNPPQASEGIRDGANDGPSEVTAKGKRKQKPNKKNHMAKKYHCRVEGCSKSHVAFNINQIVRHMEQHHVDWLYQCPVEACKGQSFKRLDILTGSHAKTCNKNGKHKSMPDMHQWVRVVVKERRAQGLLPATDSATGLVANEADAPGRRVGEEGLNNEHEEIELDAENEYDADSEY